LDSLNEQVEFSKKENDVKLLIGHVLPLEITVHHDHYYITVR